MQQEIPSLLTDEKAHVQTIPYRPLVDPQIHVGHGVNLPRVVLDDELFLHGHLNLVARRQGHHAGLHLRSIEG